MNVLLDEFDRQVTNFLRIGVPKFANIEEQKFIDQINSLQTCIKGLSSTNSDYENGRLPFVLVIKNELIPTELLMPHIVKDGHTGIVKLFPLTSSDFGVIRTVVLPESPMYVLLDIDRGIDTRNIPPSEALQQIIAKNRSPLTIDEGVAIMIHHPDFLRKNNCFSLLASRHEGDKRVPALWINSTKQPNLGWCWDGNPHTWLGSASCWKRLCNS